MSNTRPKGLAVEFPLLLVIGCQPEQGLPRPGLLLARVMFWEIRAIKEGKLCLVSTSGGQ